MSRPTSARSAGRAAMILISLALAALAAVATPSCSVDRRSPGFACERNADCDADRVCTRGFCVERGVPTPGPDAGPSNGCPAECTTCDLDGRTCAIDCSGERCARVVCPPGFDCTIECATPGGCDDIDCTAAGSCDITCIGLFACPTITCGPGECDVLCAGQTACGFLECASACRCDQICMSANACAASSCPSVGAELCTEGGEPASPCDSFAGRDCDRCM